MDKACNNCKEDLLRNMSKGCVKVPNGKKRSTTSKVVIRHWFLLQEDKEGKQEARGKS